MKKYLTLPLLSLFVLAPIALMAQMSGDNIFMPGHYIEIAIAPNGSFGSTVALPSGYYHNSESIGVYDHTTGSYTTTANRLAIIYDNGHDGWTTGSPAFFGDYTMPGTPYEGWDLEINGSQANAWYQNYQSGTSGFTGGLSMSGANTSYTDTLGVITAVWTGTAGSGGALAIVQTTTIDTNASWINVTTTFKNTSSSTLSNVYYMRAFDPDNDDLEGGSYSTTNTINYQDDYLHRVEVTAAGTHHTDETIALATKDCRAKCFSGTWPTGGGTCAQYYAGSVSGCLHTAGSSNTGDNAIGLVYNLGNIGAGDSTQVSYAFVFNGSHGIDSAVSDPQLVVNGTAIDSIDTVTACTFSGDTLGLSIINGNSNNWAGSVWRWSPTTYLLSDTGVTNGVLMTSITSTITYTITGTDSALGTCENKQFILTVVPGSTSAPTVTTPVNYCTGGTASALSATGTSLLWYTAASGGTGSTTAPTPATDTPGTTTYYVSQTISGCESARAAIDVIVSPGAGPITGPSGVCTGYTISLADTSSSGTWSSSSSSIATIGSASGVVSGLATGTTTITYTISSTGCFVTAPITVSPLPGVISVPGGVCAGSNISLADTLAGGTWTSGNTSIATIGSSSGIAGGVSAGSAPITYTSAAGCYVTSSVTVNIQPSAISGASTVCTGLTTSLSATPSGGSWSTSSGSTATVSSSGIVTGASAGGVTITYTLGSCYSTYAVTVNSTPTAISGPTSVCVGADISLSSSGSGSWYSGNTSIATVGISSGIVGGVSSNPVTITYTSGAGCSVYDTITVNPLPSSISGPTAVCAGSFISLSATPTTGTWSSSATGTATVGAASGDVWGVASGGVTITYTLPVTGCYSTDAITVNALPAAITGTLLLCEDGGTTTLTETTGGGTWSSGNTAVATVNSSGLVTGVASGSAGITYTITATGCQTSTTVNVNPLPKVINGPSAVCINATISLSDTITGGAWSSASPTVASINSSGVVTGESSGTAVITYSLGTGCSTTTTITVNSLPVAISGTMSVCASGSVTHLSDGTSGGTWSSSNTTIATVDGAGNVTGVNSGTDTITYTLTTTGCFITTPVTVNPLPSAISGPTAVCQGLTINLTDGGTGTWVSGNTSVATVTGSGLVSGVSSGSSIITYTLTATGCQITSAITVNSNPPAPSGATAVCAGSVISLTDGTSGGSWSSSNTSFATVDGSGNVTGVAAGSVTITYTLTTSCISTTGITVNALPNAISGTTSVCNTFTTNFTETSGGGSWSSGNTSVATVSTTGVVGGASAGATDITYTLAGTGCYQSAPITVNPLPANISGPTAVCLGSTVTLTDGTSGSGTWASNNPGIASIDASSGVVTGMSAGTTVITYTAGGGCYVTMTMTVHSLPASISGTLSVCEGSTVSLTDGSGTGAWSSSNTSLATIGASSGVVSGIVAGGLTITFTLATTGCQTSSSFIVNTTPVAITGTMQVCAAGSTTNLYDATPSGSWSSSSASTATIDATSGTVTGVTAGTVTITYTLGTCYNTTSVIVRPLPGAIITPLGDTMLCPGDEVALTSNTGTGYSYQWFTASGSISGETDDYYIAGTGAAYSVSVTSGFGCVSTSIPMAISINPDTATLRLATGSASIFCTGSGSATLMANTGTGLSYEWTLGGAGISGATGADYIATAGGEYQVIVSNLAGCSATSGSITLTALPSPSPTLTASGSLTFCSGDSVVLTGNTGSGLTYQWQNGGTSITGATNIHYTALASGNYQVKETNTSGCSSSSAVAAVNVLPLPSATITSSGATTFCTGGSVVLDAPAGGSGTTYQWYKNSIAITGAIGTNYAATTSGNYTVKVMAPTGCVNTTHPPTVVDEVAVPVITPVTSTKFCWGGSSLLSVSVTAAVGVTYQWQLGGINIAGATNSSYSATVSGNYSCIITIGGGCTLAAAAIVVTELPLPDPIIMFDGTTLTVGNYYVFYQWYRNLVPIGGNSSKLVPNATGNYTVRVIDSNGCQSVSNIYIVRTVGDGRGLSVNQVNPDDIKVYPNPAQSVLHIVTGGAPLKAVITALDGRKVAQQEQATDIDISSLADGVYLLMLYDQEGQMIKVEKFVKN